MPKPLRVVFAGTPPFAAAHLEAVISSRHDVVAVYTQPDRPAGRGKQLTASAVKQVALSHSLLVLQPASLKTQDEVAVLAELEADLLIVVAYGLILPLPILALPKQGCINVHASLLPRWRGAAPIHRAIESGDTETGVTIMQMDPGLDTGDMLMTAKMPIEPSHTTGSLTYDLQRLGAETLVSALNLLDSLQSTAVAQPSEGVTYAQNYKRRGYDRLGRAGRGHRAKSTRV
jgi:methionyl-tRNA formyltransferase